MDWESDCNSYPHYCSLPIYNLVVEPWFTERPELEILSVKPKIIEKGVPVSFNISLENTGGKTAGELTYLVSLKIFYKDENYSFSGFEDGCFAKGKSILKEGEITNVTFTFNLEPKYNLSIQKFDVILRVSCREGYYWQFTIEYKYDKQYDNYSLSTW